MADRDDLIDTVHRLFIATDSRDWAQVRALFAPHVQFDMTSLTGGVPQSKTGAEIAAEWESGLAAVDHVHHQSGNFLVDARGDEATVSCYATTYHHAKHDVRMFVGTYDVHFVRSGGLWRIDRFKFTVKFVHPPA